MADVSDTTVNSDIFLDDIKTAVRAIKELKSVPIQKQSSNTFLTNWHQT